MASLKSNPIFYSILALAGVVVLAEGWFIYSSNQAAAKSESALTSSRDQLAALQSVKPYPDKGNKEAIDNDLRRTETALAAMRRELQGQGPAAEQLRDTPVPAEPTDMFFNLETFVEETRAEAKEAGIKIKPDEHFGFATYATEGPERDLIPQVFRERQVAQYLLRALFASHPSEMISFQRERPLTRRQLAASAEGKSFKSGDTASSTSNGDFFEIDPRISARVPGFVRATAFRLTFVGYTQSLRILLNKLATFDLPLVVRSVEVEPFVANENGNSPQSPVESESNSLSAIFGNVPVGTATSAEAAPAKPVPLVAKSPSKFTVTVELIDLVSGKRSSLPHSTP